LFKHEGHFKTDSCNFLDTNKISSNLSNNDFTMSLMVSCV